MQNKKNILIVGFGEVGEKFALQLINVAKVYIYDPFLTEIKKIKIVKDKLFLIDKYIELEDLNIEYVFSMVPGSQSILVLEEILKFVNFKNYFDFTTANPSCKSTSYLLVKEKNKDLEYYDIAIMGSVAHLGFKVNLLGSGQFSNTTIKDIAYFDLNIKYLPDSKPGDAIALKFLRSIVTKGIEACAIECFMAAKVLAVNHHLKSMFDDMNNICFYDLLNEMIKSHPTHSLRRYKELEISKSILAKENLNSCMTNTTKSFFEKTVGLVSSEAEYIDFEKLNINEILDWNINNRTYKSNKK